MICPWGFVVCFCSKALVGILEQRYGGPYITLERIEDINFVYFYRQSLCFLLVVVVLLFGQRYSWHLRFATVYFCMS